MSPSQPLCGRFANPTEASPATDPRIDPRILRAIEKIGADSAALTPPLSCKTASLQDMIELVHEYGKAFEPMHNSIVDPEDGSGVLYSLEHAKNLDDGFDIDLHVHHPAHQMTDTLPGIVVIHGGGHVTFGAYSPLYRRWSHDLARCGLIAINVAFRNGVDDNKEHNPFPTGLNDCVAAVRWISDNRARLGLSKLIVQGGSAGANLAVATVMKLLQDGRSQVVNGIYAIGPYISGAYSKSDQWKVEQGLASLVECDGYILNNVLMGIYVAVYDPCGDNEKNPLAWTWYGSLTDFMGFPPTVITVDELDPLRDEGIGLARKMAAAGVRVVSRMNLGMLHTAALWQRPLPDLNRTCLGDIKRFSDLI